MAGALLLLETSQMTQKRKHSFVASEMTVANVMLFSRAAGSYPKLPHREVHSSSTGGVLRCLCKNATRLWDPSSSWDRRLLDVEGGRSQTQAGL